MGWAVLGASFGAIAVLAGAFGAHGLAERVEARQLEAWRTAAHYLLLHAVLITAVGLYAQSAARDPRLPLALLAAGSVLFSGSIFALVLGGPRLLGPVTPLGGLLLIAGWLATAWWARG